MYERKIPQDLEYGVTITIKVLGGKWKPCIIDCLAQGIMQPSEIHKAIPCASRRVLNQQLRELHEYQIISKRVYPELPVKVEYDLTAFGRTLLPVINVMEKWGNEHAQKVVQIARERQENIG